MSMKETIIESLGLVEIRKGGTVRKGQTFYSIDSYEDTGESHEGTCRVTVIKNIASRDFDVSLDGCYRESFNIDDLNLGSVVSSSDGLLFVIEISGSKYFVNSSYIVYSSGEVEIDEVIYYA